MTSVVEEIRAVLQSFQDGYTKRDMEAVVQFMDLFIPEEDLEVIGTGAARTGEGEWCLGREAARKIVESDWKWWGDLVLDVVGARIFVNGNTGWLATAGTISETIKAEALRKSYVEYMGELNKKEDMSDEEKALEMMRSGADMLQMIQKGEAYTWPFRFTAVLVKRSQGWLFHQMQFSYPTTRWPDVLIKTAEV
jgi:ketosteroid isomerase-like protein